MWPVWPSEAEILGVGFQQKLPRLNGLSIPKIRVQKFVFSLVLGFAWMREVPVIHSRSFRVDPVPI